MVVLITISIKYLGQPYSPGVLLVSVVAVAVLFDLHVLILTHKADG